MTERNRGKQINFRLSESEFEQFQKNFQKSKLTQSEYLRKCILEKDIFVIDDMKELVLELKRLGNNLNQITKKVNTGEVKNIDELSSMKTELDYVWREVLHALKKVNE
ncbi:plasmid mobilization protein [Clostridium cibarium]|uniref:Plasmid mobilization relaxosome protein MobC n=1 Tax=Clostridium cibarium TaxID=2762247 RepID=A0ABR8PZ82_9CLOT|nr:plasmid mobilization relaxosome protein MobC [Clostridium cibarium]